MDIHLASPGYVDTDIYKRALYRNTTYEKIMEQIQALGFKVLTASDTAAMILASVRRGRKQFALPFMPLSSAGWRRAFLSSSTSFTPKS